jgi:protease secretion system membrane fusion protein
MKNFYVTATVGLLLLLTALITWAALAPLDEGIPVNGLVSFDTKRKAVQHPIGGIVKEVRVREGDSVTAGDDLIVLASETTRAN